MSICKFETDNCGAFRVGLIVTQEMGNTTQNLVSFTFKKNLLILFKILFFTQKHSRFKKKHSKSKLMEIKTEFTD